MRHEFNAEGPADVVTAQFTAWCEALIIEWGKEAEVARSSAIKYIRTLRRAHAALRREVAR